VDKTLGTRLMLLREKREEEWPWEQKCCRLAARMKAALENDSPFVARAL